VIRYKGYTGVFEVHPEEGVIFGRVAGLRDVITFQGETVAEATKAFKDSVDDYLEFCADRGEPPEKPYSGHFVVRIAPELHRHAAQAAEASHQSLNLYIQRVLADSLNQQGFAVPRGDASAPAPLPPAKSRQSGAKAGRPKAPRD
jgi:predicted HicB family RNase H-like nuclease